MACLPAGKLTSQAVTPTSSHGQGAQRGLTHLGPIVAEDPYNADRNCFVQTPPQRLAVECKHKGDVLLTGTIDDGVQRVIQPTWSNTGPQDTG